MKVERIQIETGRNAPYELEITEQESPMRGLPRGLAGLRIVHITDLHGGFGNTEPVFEEVVARTRQLNPDLLLFTGDYVNDSRPSNTYLIERLLARFSAPLGKFGSMGNHDHRRGVAGTLKAVQRGGVRVLDNENVELPNGLWIAGLDDLDEGKPDFERALRGLPDDRTSILLSHNPRTIEKVGLCDLFVLSGHTHGAQIVLPFPSPSMVCRFHLRCKQVAGWYTNGRAREYVSRGIGVTGRPYRYHCPAELAVFTLVPAEAAPPAASNGHAAQRALPSEPAIAEPEPSPH